MYNYYQILGVEQTASADEIKRAYRTLVKLYHPDRNQGNDTYVALLLSVQKAYDVLGDREERSKYDISLLSDTMYQEPTNTSTWQEVYQKPIIKVFSCDQTYFFNGDELLINWECENADYISISSCGYMTDLKGAIKYKIKNVEAHYLIFEIKVRNSQYNEVLTQQISIENGRYKDFTSYTTKDEVVDKVYTSEMPWLLGFLGPLGRSSQKDYAVRVFILAICYGYSFWNAENFETEGMDTFIQTAIIFAFGVCSARRLHDFNQRAAWVFLLLIPYFFVLFIPYLLFKKGSEIPNQYGRPLK